MGMTMPITLGSVTIEYRSLPIQYNSDGTVTITLRKGYMQGSEFLVIGLENYSATKEEANAIMDAHPTAGLTRRDDLSLAIYGFCVSKGAEVGVIT